MSQCRKSIALLYFLLFFTPRIFFSQTIISNGSNGKSVAFKFDVIRNNMIKALDRYHRYQEILSDHQKKNNLKLELDKKEKNQLILILSMLEFGSWKDVILEDSVLFSKALVSFQSRHQMVETGKLNLATKRRILSDIVQTQNKLKSSIKRLEAVRFKNGGVVYVNIPDYTLCYIDSTGSEVLSCPVIVGKPTWPTKPLVSQIENVVFCPYWNVPQSILVKEILPIIRKKPNYVSKNNMEWVGGRLRQRPGIGNSLGLIKFNFNNPYHIYLHDTPGKKYFSKQRRAISHGCIRLSCVDELAAALLDKNLAWVSQQKNNCDQDREKQFKVVVNTQILVTYLTAWVDEKGIVQVREDIYGLDK